MLAAVLLRLALVSTLLTVPASSSDLTVIPGDSVRGAKVFRTQQCEHCHSVNGVGGKIGLDLGRLVNRNYTPAQLASTMWNHAPTMWSIIEGAGIEMPQLTREDAADLFAYFYSARFFDQPGDPARGKETFHSLRCEVCHGIEESRAEGAPAVVRWESLADPVALARQMWNHGSQMLQSFQRRQVEWQTLTTAELDDVLAYLSSLPQTQSLTSKFSNTSGKGGNRVFHSKGCSHCHTGALSLDNRLHNMTLTDIAVDMWNHAPRMIRPLPVLSEEEMRSLLSYLWMRQFVYGGGSAKAGNAVFQQRRCADCHAGGRHGAPPLLGQAMQYSEVSMIAALWRHGPQMQRRMKQAGMAWPMFGSPQEVTDLIAFLNSAQ